MDELGLKIRGESNGKRIEMSCDHHSGILYAVPSASSWVCSQDMLHIHALVGFFNDIQALDSIDIRNMMQKWGLYYRSEDRGSVHHG